MLRSIVLTSSVALAAALWPTYGGNAGRQHVSSVAPSSAKTLKKVDSAPWNQCEGEKAGMQCVWVQDVLTDGNVLLHWSAVTRQGDNPNVGKLAARAVANLSQAPWSVNVTSCTSCAKGCAVFDTASPGVFATQHSPINGSVDLISYKFDHLASRPTTSDMWNLPLGDAGTVTCFAQLQEADPSSIVFAASLDSGLELRWLRDPKRISRLQPPALPGHPSTPCPLFASDPVVIGAHRELVGLHFSCAGLQDTLAVYDIGGPPMMNPPAWTAAVGPFNLEFADTRTRGGDTRVAWAANQRLQHLDFGMLDALTGVAAFSPPFPMGSIASGFLALSDGAASAAAGAPSAPYGIFWQYRNDTGPHAVVAVGAGGDEIWRYKVDMAPKVPIMTLGVATPGGGAVVGFYETGDGATTLLRIDGQGQLVGDAVNAGIAILPPIVNNPLVTNTGGIIMWLGDQTIVRLE